MMLAKKIRLYPTKEQEHSMCKSAFFNDPKKLKVKKDKVLLEKIGWIKIRPNELPISPYKYSNPRVSFDGKYWFLAVGIEQKEPDNSLTKEIVGIDVGIKNLAVCSNGMIFSNIHKTYVVRKLEKRLHRLQRNVSSKYQKNKNGKEYAKTENIRKLEKQIKLLYRRLRNIRENHRHQITSEIVETKSANYPYQKEHIDVKAVVL